MKVKIILIAALVALVGVMFVLQRQTSTHEEEYAEEQEEHAETEPIIQEDMASLAPGNVATVKTSKGTFKFVLYDEDVPITTRNFEKLASKGFYNGLTFHRVEDVVIQGGDPKGDGTGGSDESIELETKQGLGFDAPFTVGMARSDDPNSATCQFFINKEPYPYWNGQYAAFGRVFNGMEVIGEIEKGDIIKSISISKPTEEDLKEITKLEASPSAPVNPLEPPNKR